MIIRNSIPYLDKYFPLCLPIPFKWLNTQQPEYVPDMLFRSMHLILSSSVFGCYQNLEQRKHFKSVSSPQQSLPESLRPVMLVNDLVKVFFLLSRPQF